MAPKRRGRGRGSPAKKARVTDPIELKVLALIAALQHEEHGGLVDMPLSCRKMLSAGVKSALGPGAAKDERHEFQTATADLIGEVLKEVVKIWEGKISDANAANASADSVKAQKEAAVSSAESAHEARCEEASKKQQELADVCDSLDAAIAALEEAQDAEARVEQEKEEKQEDLAQTEMLLTDHFAPLKACDWPSPKDQQIAEKKLLQPLASFLKSLKVDQALITGMGSTLKKKPEERGQFDTIVVDQVESALTTHISELKDFVGNFDKHVSQRTSAVTECKNTYEATKTKKAACQDAVEVAIRAKSESDSALLAAQEALEKHIDQMSNQTAFEALRQQSLSIANDNLSTFTFLYDRVGAMPEPEAPADEEEVEESAAAES